MFNIPKLPEFNFNIETPKPLDINTNIVNDLIGPEFLGEKLDELNKKLLIIDKKLEKPKWYKTKEFWFGIITIGLVIWQICISLFK